MRRPLLLVLLVGAAGCGRSAAAPPSKGKTVTEVLTGACSSHGATGRDSGTLVIWPTEMSSGVPKCDCSIDKESGEARCPAVNCICGDACPSTLCAAREVALSVCRQADARITPVVAVTRDHIKVTLSTGYVGSSFVFRSNDGKLVGASTFQDFGGYESELLPDFDDAGNRVEPPDASPPDTEFIAFATYAGVELSAPVQRCRICGDATLLASACDGTEWKSTLPEPLRR